MGKSTINGHFQYLCYTMLVYQRVGKQLLGDDLQRGNGEEPMIHATFSEFI
jgi:hypothetical protein